MTTPLAARINARLAQSGLSQRAFARQAGLDHATIVRLLGGQLALDALTTPTLRKLAAALGTTLADLLGESLPVPALSTPSPLRGEGQGEGEKTGAGGALTRYDAACRAIAAARTVDVAKGLRDKAEAMRAYARQIHNREIEIDAAEIRMRAERRVGELLIAQKASVGLNKGGRPSKTGAGEEPVFSLATLAEIGIDKKLSAKCQKLAAVPPARFEALVGEWRERVSHEHERVTTALLREGEIAARDAGLVHAVQPWPEGRYGVILADPPWRYELKPMGQTDRSIETHYPTLSLADITALDLASVTASHCVLFLWATAPNLEAAFSVLDAWGFTYRTQMAWVKDRIGMGFYVRNRHELVLIATRGEPELPAPADRPDSVIIAPRGAHSEKPAIVHALIERMYPGVPKLELFARQPRDGWSCWGNQIPSPGQGEGEGEGEVLKPAEPAESDDDAESETDPAPHAPLRRRRDELIEKIGDLRAAANMAALSRAGNEIGPTGKHADRRRRDLAARYLVDEIAKRQPEIERLERKIARIDERIEKGGPRPPNVQPTNPAPSSLAREEGRAKEEAAE